MAGVCSTKTWVKFFTEAGIPDSAAATYALVFVENRIQSNMLLELNKEYLKDMGITLMGDVIAILRQAKKVHEQEARERVLFTNPKQMPATSRTELVQEHEESDIGSKKSGLQVTNNINVQKESRSSNKKETKAIQPMLFSVTVPGFQVNTNDHNMQKEDTLTHETGSNTVQPAKFTVTVPEKKKRGIAQVKCQSTSMHAYHDTDEEMDLVEEDFYVPASSVPSSAVSSGKPSPPKKKKIVISNKKESPDHTTISKKTVFERLGGEKANAAMVSPGLESVLRDSITVTCNNTVPLNSRNSCEKKSVFSRLGSKTGGETAPQVHKVCPKIRSEGPALPHTGILKQTTSTVPKKKLVKKIITMRADEPKVPIHLRADSARTWTTVTRKKTPVIQRTILSTTKSATVDNNKTNTQGIFGTCVNTSRVNIKQRLGTSQALKRLPTKQLVLVGKEEEHEDDSEVLDMDSSVNRLSTNGLQNKKVTFGSVMQKSIPRRLSLNSPLKSVGQGSITMGTGVFSRLGRNTL